MICPVCQNGELRLDGGIPGEHEIYSCPNCGAVFDKGFGKRKKMTEPVYCKDCHIYEYCKTMCTEVLKIKKSIDYDKPCKKFKPREGDGE